jgi:hypothetical protein
MYPQNKGKDDKNGLIFPHMGVFLRKPFPYTTMPHSRCFKHRECLFDVGEGITTKFRFRRVEFRGKIIA